MGISRKQNTRHCVLCEHVTFFVTDWFLYLSLWLLPWWDCSFDNPCVNIDPNYCEICVFLIARLENNSLCRDAAIRWKNNILTSSCTTAKLSPHTHTTQDWPLYSCSIVIIHFLYTYVVLHWVGWDHQGHWLCCHCFVSHILVPSTTLCTALVFIPSHVYTYT